MELPPDNRISTLLREYHLKLDELYGASEAESLFCYLTWYFLRMSRSEIHQRSSETVSESELLRFHFALKDLMKYKPVQYITGETEFCGLRILVNESVLIPRPETEELAYLIRDEVKIRKKNPEVIIDLCTGSGCLAIAMKKFFPRALVTGTDISSDAINTAVKNAELNSLHVNFLVNDLLQSEANDFLPLTNSGVDILISNPPYIAKKESAMMSPNVLEYEPEIALFADENDPLNFYRKIASLAKKLLNRDGLFFLEMNEHLSIETKEIFLENFNSVTVQKDLQNKPRFLVGSA